MTDYSRGDSANIIVGAAAFFVSDNATTADPTFVADVDAKYTLTNATGWENVGYTSNGLDLTFEPDFGEVKVDQLLDVAKMFKQGMKVSMKTSFAEATLENLLIAIAQADTTKTTNVTNGDVELTMKSGELGEYPLERKICAVGASVEPAAGESTQRVYLAYRALSIESVTVSAKRDEATMFEVNFRLLPDSNGAYGKIIDRSITTPTS